MSIYLPLDVLAEADKRAKRSGRSRSDVVALALAAHFGLPAAVPGQMQQRGTP